MTRFAILAPVAALLLTGCAVMEARDKAVETVRYAVGELEEFVYETDALREEIRRVCVETLWEEVDALREAGDLEAVRARLRAAYPPLVTSQVLAAREGDGLQGLFAEPMGC